jgi:uncharacterized membrane protein
VQREFRDQLSGAERLALALGWFSVGLGVAELAAPGAVARLIGINDDQDEQTLGVLRACGARELGAGLAILAQPQRATWLWSRVGGDAVDLSLLGTAAQRDDANRGRLGAAAAAVAGVTALDIIAARRLQQQSQGATRHSRSARVHVERVTTINRPIEEVFQFWRRFENFPRFMRHLESVVELGGRRSRWTATGPAGTRVTWEAEMTEEREPELIAWRSVEGSAVEHSGSVRFDRAPGARGTEVRVRLDYRPPAGSVGRGIAWLFGEEPEQQIHEDLHRFKQLMETGEIPLSDGPSLWRPAQPAKTVDTILTHAGVER